VDKGRLGETVPLDTDVTAALVLGGALEMREEVATPEVEGREVEGTASVVDGADVISGSDVSP